MASEALGGRPARSRRPRDGITLAGMALVAAHPSCPPGSVLRCFARALRVVQRAGVRGDQKIRYASALADGWLRARASAEGHVGVDRAKLPVPGPRRPLPLHNFDRVRSD